MTTQNPLLETKVPFNTGSGEAHLYSLKKLEEISATETSADSHLP
jgi:aconitate hydratase